MRGSPEPLTWRYRLETDRKRFPHRFGRARTHLQCTLYARLSRPNLEQRFVDSNIIISNDLQVFVPKLTAAAQTSPRNRNLYPKR
jgi:hypothetical protein